MSRVLITSKYQSEVYGMPNAVRFNIKAPATVTVPNVVGMTLAAATAALAAVTLGIEVFGDSSQVASAQSPIAGAIIPGNSAVNVIFGPFPELIVNGTFGTNLLGWTNNSETPSEVIWNASQKAMFRGLADGKHARLRQDIAILGLGIGKRFRITFNISSLTAGAGYTGTFVCGTLSNPSRYYMQDINVSQTYETIFTAAELDIIVAIDLVGNTSSFLLDNVSLKRIDG
jgi:hypothetical protein